ncbi:histidine phosphotransferase ChpT [Azospirillaceae bacterium]
MSLNLDLRLAEILSAKLCHDLAAPAGAVHNGLELLAEAPKTEALDELAHQALALAEESAERLIRRLRLLRLAYGPTSDESKAPQNNLFAVSRTAAIEWLTTTRIKILWPVEILPKAASHTPGLSKLLLLLILVAEEALPSGGEIMVSGDGDAENGTVRVEVYGPNLKVSHETLLTLTNGSSLTSLTPRLVSAFLASRIAEYYCFTLETLLSNNARLHISFSWRSAAPS